MARNLITPGCIMRYVLATLHTEFNIPLAQCHAYRRFSDDCTIVQVLCPTTAGRYEFTIMVTIDECEWTIADLIDRIIRPACQTMAFKVWSGEDPKQVSMTFSDPISWVGSESYDGR